MWLMSVILIVSYKEDAHTRFVVKKARARGLKTMIFDASVYPHTVEIAITLKNCELSPLLTFRFGNSLLRAEDVSGVWWRRPQGLRKSFHLTSMGQYIQVESESVIRSLRDFIPRANWISDPEATRLANRKPVQLEVAKEVGLKIPETCITNSPKELRRFIKFLGIKKLAMKPVGSSFMQLAPRSRLDSRKNKVVFTQIVDPEIILENIDMVRNCPVIFQEAIIKDSDIRATVVDDRVFAVEITLEGCREENNLDWRNYAGQKVYKTHTLPPDVQLMCIEVCRRLGLRFGCIDLGFSKKDGYTFFEINPQGQWLPSEVQLGYNISESILDSLTK